MSYFSNAFKKNFVGFGPVKTTGDTSKLNPGELGLYDASTYQALPAVTANPKPYKMFRLVQGSMHTKDSIHPLVGGLKESVKSRPINPRYIEKFWKVNPSRPKNDVWTIGYNGVSTCQPITGECGAKYTIRIDVEGEAALRTYNRNLYRYFTIETPCCDDCDVTCDPAVADPYLMGKELVEKINSDVELSHFVKAELILETAIADANEVTYDKFVLDIKDQGTPADFTAVASAYPTYEITRESYSGITSRYSVIVANGVTPSSYTPTALSLPADACGDCPTGWTVGLATREILVSKVLITDTDGDGANDITLEEALALALGNQGTSTSVAYEYRAEIDTLLSAIDSDVQLTDIQITATQHSPIVGNTVVIKLAITVEDVNAPTTPHSLTAEDIDIDDLQTAVEDDLTDLGSTVLCEPPAGSATAWVADGSVYKTKRQLCATFSKECGTSASELANITAFFADDPNISTIAQEAGDTDCAEVISLYQLSKDYYEVGCLEKPIPTYGDAPSYKGVVFEPCDCPPVASPYVSGAVGIRLTAAYEDTKFGTCSFNPLDYYDIKPLKLTVSKIDDAELCTDQHTKWSVTHLVTGKQPQGLGESVLRSYMEYMGGYKGERFNLDPRWREVQDQQHLNVIDKTKYYKTYYLMHSIPNSHMLGMNVTNYDEKYVYAIHFAEDVDTTSFENLLSGYAALNNVELEVYD